MSSKPIKQAGFTLVELVIVILVLGILAATAMPRFMNVNTSAFKAAVAGVAGGFGSALQLGHAQWVVGGNNGTVASLAGFGAGNVAFSSNGWPTDTAGATSVPASAAGATQCASIWSGIMQNPPSIASNATGSDWCAATPTVAGQCTYIYLKDSPSASSCATTATGVSRYFTYDSTSGSVALTNP